MMNDLGLLALRLGFGGMMLFAHGLPKLMGFAEKSAAFADPLGVGAPISLALAILAEVFCSLGVMLGLLTRLSSLPLMFTMGMAALVIHRLDPWAKKELALVYFVAFLAIFLLGAGKYSLDSRLKLKWK